MTKESIPEKQSQSDWFPKWFLVQDFTNLARFASCLGVSAEFQMTI